MKLSAAQADQRAIDALRDVADNDGMMWRCETGHEAAILWSELQRRGWVDGATITNAGRTALSNSKGE